MNKVTLALKSRTFWTVVVMLVFNVLPNLPLSQPTRDLVNSVLTLLAAYFHVNPSQNYNPPTLTTIDTAPPSNAQS